METKMKSRKFVGKLGSMVSAKTQPSALRHHKLREDKVAVQRAEDAKRVVVVLPEGFERRTAYVSDNKRGQVYVVQRLSDPKNKAEVAGKIEKITSEKSKALEFLQSIGVASALGQLTERFGG